MNRVKMKYRGVDRSPESDNAENVLAAASERSDTSFPFWDKVEYALIPTDVLALHVIWISINGAPTLIVCRPQGRIVR
jgi:hypothetical protein